MQKIKKIMAPFKVTTCFGYFGAWWMILAVTLLGPIVDAWIQTENRWEYFIASGALYYNIITLLFSAVVTSIIDVIFEKVHDDGELEFIHYQGFSVAFSTIGIIFLIFLYIYFRKIAWLQIGSSLLGYPFCYYLYCISCMPRVKKEMNEFTVSYDKQRKEHSGEMQKGKSTSSDGINLGGGNA